MVKHQNSKRREDKYLLSYDKYEIFKSILIDENFFRDHSPNYINNIYFDNYKSDSLIENIEGETNRVKYRIRFYNQSDKYIFEKKIKEGKSGKKEKKVLFSKSINNAVKEVKNILPNHVPNVQNKYFREYYNNQNGIRVTIDSKLTFKKYDSKIIKQFSSLIIEVKYMANDNFEFNNFNLDDLKLTKFSKYVNGFKILNSWSIIRKDKFLPIKISK